MNILDVLSNHKHIHFLGLYDFKIIKLLKVLEEKTHFKFSYDTSLPSKLAAQNIKLQNEKFIKNNESYLDLLIHNIMEISKI